MTRDYNKQPRDDTRSSSRNQSPNRTGDERSPRPPRPRLSRETVDRAWESGAPTQHADYRTRSSNGQPPRNSWRNNQQSEHSPAQNGRRPYGPRGNNQGNQRSFERTPNGNFGPRPQPFGTGSNRSNDQRFNSRPGTSRGPLSNGNQGSFRENQRPHEQRPPFRDTDQNRGYQRRDFTGPDRRANGLERTNRPPRDFGRDEQSPRTFDRKPRDFGRDERSPRNSAHGNRPPYPAEQRDTQNPRWQSRPVARQDSASQERPHFNEREQGKLFEGDYERFDSPAEQKRSDKPTKPYKSRKKADAPNAKLEEQHVTRLPDGRVLKGPRPVQRKNAQFWSEISNETEQLIDRVEVPASSDGVEAQPVELQQDGALPQETQEEAMPQEIASTTEEAVSKKPRTRAASAITRSKKVAVKKPRSTGPKPSQRGYKWPTTE
jgi:hypothetical protein